MKYDDRLLEDLWEFTKAFFPHLLRLFTCWLVGMVIGYILLILLKAAGVGGIE